MNIFLYADRLVFSWYSFYETKVIKKNRAPCEDRTHDLQISNIDYETDALPTALTRHLCTCDLNK